MTKPTTRTRLEDALGRLLAGQPTVTDGQLTVSNLCREAGVGRDSYYRTPGLAERFAAAKANAQARQPELLQLREQAAALKRDRKQLVAEHAAVVRDLEDTVRTYADHIQVLTLRNAELQQHHRRLLERLERAAPEVARLADHR